MPRYPFKIIKEAIEEARRSTTSTCSSAVEISSATHEVAQEPIVAVAETSYGAEALYEEADGAEEIIISPETSSAVGAMESDVHDSEECDLDIPATSKIR